MDKVTLLSLLESEREMLTAGINADRSPEAAQTQVTRTLERVSMRYAEQCGDPAARQAAQLVTRTLISAVPFIDSIGESRRWSREAGAAKRRRVKPLAIALLAAAAVLELAVLLGLMLAGGRLSGFVVVLEALLPGLLALGAAFWAGRIDARPEKPADAPEQLREEYLVDAEKLWHHLRGMVLMADSALERAQAEAEARRQSEAAQPGGALDRQAAELFSGLLESAYALDGPEAREMAEAMRFYLHGVGVEAVDCTPDREAWFEFLPADRPGTLRPALVQGERVLRKGLAAR